MKSGLTVVALIFTIASPLASAQSALPTISSERAAARTELGQLMVEYSAQSFARQAAEGDTYAVRLFLLAGMDVDAFTVPRPLGNQEPSTATSTALISAASRGRTETVQLLLAAHADVNLRPGTLFTPLMRAAERGFLDTVRVLLTAGADVNVKSKAPANGTSMVNYDITALELASMYGYTEIATVLLDKGAYGGSAVATGSCGPPVPFGGNAGHVDTVRVLVEKGGKVDALTPSNLYNSDLTGLVCAIRNKQIPLVRLLLDRGADPNLRNPMLAAIDAHSGEAVELLLAHGANVNGSSTENPNVGDRPLLRAMSNGFADTARVLIDRGADVNVRDAAGGTALMSAATKGDTDTVRALLARSVDVNAKNRSGETALIAAASRGYTEIVKALIDRGADVNIVTQSSNTPLKAAAGRSEIIQLLTNAGAKP